MKMAPALWQEARRVGGDFSTFELSPAMLRAIAAQNFPKFRFLVRKAMRGGKNGNKEKEAT